MPPALGKLTALGELYVHNCPELGQVPVEVRQMTNLEWLFADNPDERATNVKSGDELLADVDMDQDPMLQDIEAAASDEAKSPAVKLADNYPFIRSASMALRRHNFD